MALRALRQRRFYGARYYGDGSYPQAPSAFVLTDRATGALYRVTAPGGVLTLVNISALASTDKLEDFMTVQDINSPVYYNAYVLNGALGVEPTKSFSRSAYVQDGGTRYIVKHSAGALVTVPV